MTVTADQLGAPVPSSSFLNKRLRSLISQRQAVMVPGAFDALAARIIEDTGFEIAYVSGAGVTNGHLGLPDLGFISLSELTAVVGAIRNVTTIPLIVDADTGFGNAVNTWHTVRVLENAGANAIQIEDQVFPKRCGHFENKQVLPAEEMEQKIRAAAAARRDADLTIIARTDAYASEGLDAAIQRAQRYVGAGADVTFVEAPRSLDDLRAIVGAIDAPQVVNLVIGGKTPPVSQADLRKLGAGLVLYANAALQGAIDGMQKTLSALQRTGDLRPLQALTATFEERQRLVGKPSIDLLEQEFLGEDAVAARKA